MTPPPSRSSSVGNGEVDILQHLREDVIEVPGQLRSPARDLQELTERIYPDLDRHTGDAEWLQQRAVLTPLNADVERINIILMRKVLPEGATVRRGDLDLKGDYRVQGG